MRFISDSVEGIRRTGRRKPFSYLFKSKPVRNEAMLRRIQALVIPPAWTQVWISPFENNHLQATGRDARGRKQYRYHTAFRQNQDAAKFTNLVPFARALPRIRRRVKRDLGISELNRDHVIAAVVALLEKTLIRIGNDEYVKQNHSFGLSSLRNNHVHRKGRKVSFDFTGKSGVAHSVDVTNDRLVKIILQCHDLPGRHLFEYRDLAGKVHAIDSSDVNDYIRAAAGGDFTAKSFRTWWGTVLAAEAFEKASPPVRRPRDIAKVVKEIAGRLRNTPAICRRYYIHPALIAAVEDGSFSRKIGRARQRAKRNRQAEMTMIEKTVLEFLSRGRR